MNITIYLTILFFFISISLITIIIGSIYSIKKEKFTTSNINPVVPTKTLVYITDTSVNNNVNNCAACSIFDTNNKNIVKKFGNMGRDSIRILDWAKSF